MASDEDKCTKYPDFAVVCSFIENFSEKLKISLPNIEELQILLEDTDNVNLHLAKSISLLLRRINKSVKFDRWERGLQRFAHSYSHQDGWELERFGFKKSKLEVKIRVIKNLLEAQFDLYKSFKEKVNTVSAKELRLEPCGRDRNGVSYWCQMDACANIRIYRDDQDEETWTLVAQSREEVESLIAELREKSMKVTPQQLSGEESQSDSNTPMILSEALTPISSKAPSPLAPADATLTLQEDTGHSKEKEECAAAVQGDATKSPSNLEGLKCESKCSFADENEKSTNDVDAVKEDISPEEKRKSDDASGGSQLVSRQTASANSDEKKSEPATSPSSVSKVESPNADIPSDLSPVRSDMPIPSLKISSPEFKKKSSKLNAVLDMAFSKNSSLNVAKKEEESNKEISLKEAADSGKQDEQSKTAQFEDKNSTTVDVIKVSETEERLSARVPKEPDKDGVNKRKLENVDDGSAKRGKIDSISVLPCGRESVSKQEFGSNSSATPEADGKSSSNGSSLKSDGGVKSSTTIDLNNSELKKIKEALKKLDLPISKMDNKSPDNKITSDLKTDSPPSKHSHEGLAESHILNKEVTSNNIPPIDDQSINLISNSSDSPTVLKDVDTSSKTQSSAEICNDYGMSDKKISEENSVGKEDDGRVNLIASTRETASLKPIESNDQRGGNSVSAEGTDKSLALTSDKGGAKKVPCASVDSYIDGESESLKSKDSSSAECGSKISMEKEITASPQQSNSQEEQKILNLKSKEISEKKLENMKSSTEVENKAEHSKSVCPMKNTPDMCGSDALKQQKSKPSKICTLKGNAQETAKLKTTSEQKSGNLKSDSLIKSEAELSCVGSGSIGGSMEDQSDPSQMGMDVGHRAEASKLTTNDMKDIETHESKFSVVEKGVDSSDLKAHPEMNEVSKLSSERKPFSSVFSTPTKKSESLQNLSSLGEEKSEKPSAPETMGEVQSTADTKEIKVESTRAPADATQNDSKSSSLSESKMEASESNLELGTPKSLPEEKPEIGKSGRVSEENRDLSEASKSFKTKMRDAKSIAPTVSKFEDPKLNKPLEKEIQHSQTIVKGEERKLEGRRDTEERQEHSKSGVAPEKVTSVFDSMVPTDSKSNDEHSKVCATRKKEKIDDSKLTSSAKENLEVPKVAGERLEVLKASPEKKLDLEPSAPTKKKIDYFKANAAEQVEQQVLIVAPEKYESFKSNSSEISKTETYKLNAPLVEKKSGTTSIGSSVLSEDHKPSKLIENHQEQINTLTASAEGVRAEPPNLISLSEVKLETLKSDESTEKTKDGSLSSSKGCEKVEAINLAKSQEKILTDSGVTKGAPEVSNYENLKSEQSNCIVEIDANEASELSKSSSSNTPKNSDLLTCKPPIISSPAHNEGRTSIKPSSKSSSFNISGLLGKEPENSSIPTDRKSVITSFSNTDSGQTCKTAGSSASKSLTDAIPVIPEKRNPLLTESGIVETKNSEVTGTSETPKTDSISTQSSHVALTEKSRLKLGNDSQKESTGSSDDLKDSSNADALSVSTDSGSSTSKASSKNEEVTSADKGKAKVSHSDESLRTVASNLSCLSDDKSQATENVSSRETVDIDHSSPFKTLNVNKPNEVGEAIEEPVMLIKGNGEGKLCDSLNALGEEECAPHVASHRGRSNQSSCRCDSPLRCCCCERETEVVHWWEDFSGAAYKYAAEDATDDVIVENVQYFFGEGEGADCDAANSDDEEKDSVRSSRLRSFKKDVNGVREEDMSPKKDTKLLKENDENVPSGNNVNGKAVVSEKVECEEVKTGNESKLPAVTEDSNAAEMAEEAKKTPEDEEQEEDSHPESTTTIVKKSRGRPKKGTWRKFSSRADSAPVEKQSQNHVEEHSLLNAEVPDGGRRLRSARIAKIREKEEKERRDLEAESLRQMAEENKEKKLKERVRIERRYLRDLKKAKKEKKEKKKRKKRRKKKAKKPQSSNPWARSSSSSSSSSEEDELEMEEEELVFKSDHEFSPESDVEDEAAPIKRARTARRMDGETSEAAPPPSKDDDDMDDAACHKCHHQDHPETILLCDNCDLGWHLSCLRPPLLSVPEGDWICPTCEHSQLIERLQGILVDFDTLKKQLDNDEERRQRLAYINVSLDNILPEKKKKRRRDSGSNEASDEDSDSEENTGSDDETGSSDDSSGSDSDSSGPLYTLRARSSRNTKEQIENFDELIDEAIRDELEAAEALKKEETEVAVAVGSSAPCAVVGRGKDIATIMEGEVEEDMNEAPMSGVELEEDDTEVEEGETKFSIPLEDSKEAKKEEPPVQEEEESKNTSDSLDVKETVASMDEDNDEDAVVGVRGSLKRALPRRSAASSAKKKRRLTDLEFEDEDHESDEDFLGASEEDDEEEEDEVEEEPSDASFELDSQESCDDSDYDSRGRLRRGRGKKGGSRIIEPLRRSTRSTRTSSYNDYDSDYARGRGRKGGKRRSRVLNSSSSEEDEIDEEFNSSDSTEIVIRKKKKNRRPPALAKKRNRKKKGGRNAKKKKGIKKKADGADKPPKPRVRYAKPVKRPGDDLEEGGTGEDGLLSSRRVTRGRKITYFDPIVMTEDEEEEQEEKPRSRGKVMKGEKVSDESGSEFELSDEERRRRSRGVYGSAGRGKVLKGEEEDEEEEEEKKGSDGDYKYDEERDLAGGDSDDESDPDERAEEDDVQDTKKGTPSAPPPNRGEQLLTNKEKFTPKEGAPTASSQQPQKPPIVSIIPKSASNTLAGTPPDVSASMQQPRLASVLAAAGSRASLPATLSITPVSAGANRTGGPMPPTAASVRLPSVPTAAQIRPAESAPPEKKLPQQQQSSVGKQNSPDLAGWSSPSNPRYAPPPHTSVTSHSGGGPSPFPHHHYGPPGGGPADRYPPRPNFPPFHPPGAHIRGDPRHPFPPPPGHPAYSSLMGGRFPPHHNAHPGVESFRGRHPHSGIPPQVYPGDKALPFRGLEPVPFSGLDAVTAAARHHPTTTTLQQPTLPPRKDLPPEASLGGGEFSSGLMSYFSSQRDENAD